MQNLSMKHRCIIGFTLFSMFFGAGNLIFPPLLGAQAGRDTLLAMAGLGLTAVLLPILSVMAVARHDGLTNPGRQYSSGTGCPVRRLCSSDDRTLRGYSANRIHQL